MASFVELGQGLSGIPPAVIRRGNPWRVVRRNTTRTTNQRTQYLIRICWVLRRLKAGAILVDVATDELSKSVVKCLLSEIIRTSII